MKGGRRRKRKTKSSGGVNEISISKLSKEYLAALDVKFEDDVISELRKSIHEKVIEESNNIHQGNFRIIEPSDLELLFDLYDRTFFDNFFSKNLKSNLEFRVSTRMTRAGGKTAKHLKKEEYTITLSSILLAQSFIDEKREITVNGVVCKDRLDAAMRIMEHEMLHLLEFVLFDSTSCSRQRFRKLGNNYFKHTDTKHKLVSKYELDSKYHDLKSGDIVTFQHHGMIHTGIISRITKRATVLVEDQNGIFKDRNGKRFQKFYVPLFHLTPEDQI